jgi:hypothetical protein
MYEGGDDDVSGRCGSRLVEIESKMAEQKIKRIHDNDLGVLYWQKG